MQKKKYFKDITETDRLLSIYKSSPTEDNLLILYEELDKVITVVTKRISMRFSKKNVEDFADLQQEVRLNIYTHLKGLADLAEDGNNLISILVKGCMWSFNVNYRKHKKNTTVKWNPTGSNSSTSSWLYDHDIPIQTSLEAALGSYDDPAGPGDKAERAQGGLQALVWVEPIQEQYLAIVRLPDELVCSALFLNRFNSKAGMLKYCLESLLEGYKPSPIVIEKRWNDPNGKFYLEYSLVLLKLALLQQRN